MKKTNVNRQNHVPNTKIGMGDYYGSGVRNPMGSMRESYMDLPDMTSKSKGKAPKSLG